MLVEHVQGLGFDPWHYKKFVHFSIRQNISGTDELGHMVLCLLHKCEDLSSDPQHPQEKQGMVTCPATLVLEKQRVALGLAG